MVKLGFFYGERGGVFRFSVIATRVVIDVVISQRQRMGSVDSGGEIWCGCALTSKSLHVKLMEPIEPANP